jgi:hypothetical protein
LLREHFLFVGVPHYLNHINLKLLGDAQEPRYHIFDQSCGTRAIALSAPAYALPRGLHGAGAGPLPAGGRRALSFSGRGSQYNGLTGFDHLTGRYFGSMKRSSTVFQS